VKHPDPIHGTQTLVGLHSTDRPLPGYNRSVVNDAVSRTALSLEIDQITCEVEAIQLAEQPESPSLIDSRNLSTAFNAFETALINQAMIKLTSKRRRKQ
jgi:hypothetical protein